MSNIATKLSEISAVKSALKGALTAKGIDMTNVPFNNYPEKINEISTGISGSLISTNIYSYNGSDKDAGIISIPDADYIVIHVGNYFSANFNWSFTSTGTYANWIETEYQTTHNSRYFRSKLWILKNTSNLKITFNKQISYCQIYKLTYKDGQSEVGEIDVLWLPSNGTSFFAKETSGFEKEPYISDSESSYGSAYCIYANPSSTAKVSFPIDFRQYKYYGIIFGAYSYYSEGENNLKVECGNFIRKSSTSGTIAPITCFLSSDNTGITGSGKCYLTRTRGTNGSTRAYIYKIFATNVELSNLML